MVLPKALYDALDAGESGRVGLSCRGFWVCEAAGYYTGAVDGADAYPVLAPLSAYRQLSASRAPTYCKVHVTLTPSLNRELERFTEIVNTAAASQGTALTALRAVIWDGELRQAVSPLERALELMRMLYPVVLALSLLSAAGVAVLFVMLLAKEAAILRVQGTAKIQTILMLSLQRRDEAGSSARHCSRDGGVCGGVPGGGRTGSHSQLGGSDGEEPAGDAASEGVGGRL